MRRLEYRIEQPFDGVEVGTIMRAQLNMGRKTIRHAKYVENGILLDGVHVYTVARAREGQVLRVAIGDSEADLANQDMKAVPGVLDIVFEDEDLIVLNKPAGMPTHPGPKHPEDSIGNVLIYYYQETHQNCLLHPIHRLDWGTSGLLVFAKNGFAQDVLQKRFHSMQFKRSYVALCHGVPSPLQGVVEGAIGLINKRWLACTEAEGGKFARSHYRVLATNEAAIGSGECAPQHAASLVELHLETGRTHQIRIHMAQVACPLFGDSLYGGSEELISRPALHSYSLSFEHPITNQMVQLYAPLPPDFQNAICELHIPCKLFS